MRLAKFLAQCGLASRRHCERLIAEGNVLVNGTLVRDPAFGVEPTDIVEHQGQRLTSPLEGDLVYLMLHKPVGVVSTMQIGTEQGRSLSDLVELSQRIFPIGRLDQDSSGLLLLTNDGDLTQRIAHPSHRVEKEYLVKVRQQMTQHQFRKIMAGVSIEGRRVLVDNIASGPGGRIALTIHEGRKRIVRRLLGEVGLTVVELKRIRIGGLYLRRLGIGKWRKLTPQEIQLLKKM